MNGEKMWFDCDSPETIRHCIKFSARVIQNFPTHSNSIEFGSKKYSKWEHASTNSLMYDTLNYRYISLLIRTVFIPFFHRSIIMYINEQWIRTFQMIWFFFFRLSIFVHKINNVQLIYSERTFIEHCSERLSHGQNRMMNFSSNR